MSGHLKIFALGWSAASDYSADWESMFSSLPLVSEYVSWILRLFYCPEHIFELFCFTVFYFYPQKTEAPGR